MKSEFVLTCFKPESRYMTAFSTHEGLYYYKWRFLVSPQP